MVIKETSLKGAYIIDIVELRDDRGFFARSWCTREFKEQGLVSRLVQMNISFNERRGTLRGLHYQAEPYAETKIVRCTKGAIHDVIVDLRRESPTYKKWINVELSADNHRMLYISPGFAHGFQTLEDRVEVFYQMSEFYEPSAGRGVRYDDPAFKIEWPLPVSSISSKDANLPHFD